jgi:hypothetical protein
MSKYTVPKYTKKDHFRHKLDKFQGKSDLIEKIKNKMKEMDIDIIDSSNIRAILKELELYEWYDDIPYIMKQMVQTSFTIKEEMFECPICFEEDKMSVIELDCKHKFCQSCVIKIKNTGSGIMACPLCRKKHFIKIFNKLTPEQINKLLADFDEEIANLEPNTNIRFHYLLQKLCEKNGIEVDEDNYS